MRPLLALLPLLAGCSVDVAVGCDFRNGSLNGPEARCQERTGVQATSFGPACEASGGEVVDGGCPTDGILGGCDLGSDVVDWYYAPETAETIAAECEGEGEVLPAP